MREKLSEQIKEFESIIKPNGKIYFLEINTLPGFTDTSLFPKSATAYGLGYSELIKKIIEIINDQILMLSALSKGYKATTNKTVKKTNPKLLLVPIDLLFIQSKLFIL